jgi:hypothetical protein
MHLNDEDFPRATRVPRGPDDANETGDGRFGPQRITWPDGTQSFQWRIRERSPIVSDQELAAMAEHARMTARVRPQVTRWPDGTSSLEWRMPGDDVLNQAGSPTGSVTELADLSEWAQTIAEGHATRQMTDQQQYTWRVNGGPMVYGRPLIIDRTRTLQQVLHVIPTNVTKGNNKGKGKGNANANAKAKAKAKAQPQPNDDRHRHRHHRHHRDRDRDDNHNGRQHRDRSHDRHHRDHRRGGTGET